MRPVPMIAMVLPVTSSPREWQIGMPVSPLVIASEVLGRPHLAREHAEHEEGELGSGLGEDVGRVGERNFIAVGIGAVDVVESNGVLGHDFQRTFAGLEHIGIYGIPQRSDEAVDAGFDLFDNHALRRNFRLWIDFDFVAAAA